MRRFFSLVAEVIQEQSLAAAEKLRRASPHWMRHTHATHALERGVDLILRDNLRHASLAITSIYLHTDEENCARQGERLVLVGRTESLADNPGASPRKKISFGLTPLLGLIPTRTVKADLCRPAVCQRSALQLGKRTPYEFGVNLSLAVTAKEGLMVGMRSMPGNPYDGHTVDSQIEQIQILVASGPGLRGWTVAISVSSLRLRGDCWSATRDNRPTS